MDNISVIIRNRNEDAHIGFAIQSCLDHFNKPEIIIVDNNSTDDSLHNVISKRYIWSHFTKKRIENMFSIIENRQFLHNAFCFYNRQFLIDNPMPEQYAGKEDRYWAIDMVSKNFKYLYDGKHQTCNHFYTNNGATWKGIG